MSAFSIDREGELAILWFDLPGEKVNKFSSTVMTEFASIVDELERSTDIKQVIVASRKAGIFIAGADVSEFTKATSPAAPSPRVQRRIIRPVRPAWRAVSIRFWISHTSR